MENCTLELTDNGVIIAHYRKGLVVDIETAKELLQQRLDFQKGKSYPFIIHVNGIDMNKEARLFMGKEGTVGIAMGAFILKNYIEQVMFNFFAAVEKPALPTKGFTSEKAAMKWIEKQRNKQE